MSLAAIEKLICQKIGIDAKIIGSRPITKAVETRRVICGIADVDAYFQILRTSPQEFAELVELIVVPETWFFRDRHPFEYLMNQVRSQQLSKPTGAKLRLLSVPCSTGEEPYSLAMTLLEAGLASHRFSVDAIDISQQALSKAERGIYGKNSFRGEDFIPRQRYFRQINDTYEISASVRQTVNFRQGNLLNLLSEQTAKYDVIFCRNLLIYLDASACNQVMSVLKRLLLPQGLLFVGAAETVKVKSDSFNSLRQPFTFGYQKLANVVTSPPIETPLPAIKHEPIAQKQSKILATPVNHIPARPSITQPIIKSHPKAAPESSLDTARRLADEGQIETAIEHCQQYLNSDRTSATAYTLMGTLYQAKTENVQAEIYFQKALYLNPQCYEALVHLALLKEHRGDIAGAQILQKRIQKLHTKTEL